MKKVFFHFVFLQTNKYNPHFLKIAQKNLSYFFFFFSRHKIFAKNGGFSRHSRKLLVAYKHTNFPGFEKKNFQIQISGFLSGRLISQKTFLLFFLYKRRKKKVGYEVKSARLEYQKGSERKKGEGGE